MDRISSNEAATRMPPEGKPLSPEQIAKFKLWIEQGAIAPGLPTFLQPTSLTIEPVTLPNRAAYPGLRPTLHHALANWMTSRSNPLTARVAVNHVWLHHMHAPLVSTVTDFGRNGTLPSHLELLDWLAVGSPESLIRVLLNHNDFMTIR